MLQVTPGVWLWYEAKSLWNHSTGNITALAKEWPGNDMSKDCSQAEHEIAPRSSTDEMQ